MSEIKSGVSIIICCFNSASRIQTTLLHLSKQFISNLEWELIIVDNGSSDDTAMVALEYWKSLRPDTAITVIPESKIGLSYARHTGITSAQFDTIILCDDDNWLSETYVKNAHDLMLSDKTISIVGGWCNGAFEIELPVWSELFLPTLSVYKASEHSGYTEKPVLGAGMVLRRSDYMNLLEIGFSSQLSDRKGNQLASGGDTELCLAMLLSDKKIYFSTQLYFQHFITQNRLNKNYFSRLLLGHVHHNNILAVYDLMHHKRDSSFQSVLIAIILSNLKRSLFFSARFFLKGSKYYSWLYALHFWKRFSVSIMKAKTLRFTYDYVKSVFFK